MNNNHSKNPISNLQPEPTPDTDLTPALDDLTPDTDSGNPTPDFGLVLDPEIPTSDTDPDDSTPEGAVSTDDTPFPGNPISSPNNPIAPDDLSENLLDTAPTPPAVPLDTPEAMAAALEAILFMAGEPVSQDALLAGLTCTALELETAMAVLSERCDTGLRGLRLLRLDNAYQLVTHPHWAPYIEKVLRPARKQSLSQAVLETLVIVAYRQPITRSEVEAIRGVKCDYSMSVLVERGFIHEVGRKDAVGRPIMYGTTIDFLRHFGLNNLEQLPPLPALLPQGEA